MAKAVMLDDAVLVAGHPRSGTSLACQLVESAGVTFPSDFEGDDYNRAGYYEIKQAKELSKELLQKAMTPEITGRMNKVVRLLNDVQGTAGLKLVRVPALFFYRHVAKNLRLVLIYRHPADVKASLFKRGLGEFSLSWFKNNNALIAAYENVEDSIIISYESIINRAQHVKDGFESLGLSINFDRVDRDLQTQDNSRICLREEEKELYGRLQELEQESCTN